MALSPGKDPSTLTNHDVDYVIHYRFDSTDPSLATKSLESLLSKLSSIGLSVSVRNGGNKSLLIFVKMASERALFAEVYKSRVRDWLHGLRQAAPERETQTSLAGEPLTDAERLRIVHQLISGPTDEGGANIVPGAGEFKNVEAIFALHDQKFNKDWILNWGKEWFVQPEQLTRLRDKLGEKVAFYFAFLQSYFAFLVFPAAFGASAYVLLGYYSPIYAIVNCLWCVGFVEYWKHQEKDLAVRWGVRGVGAIQTKRGEFQHAKEITDPVTGEKVKFFPAGKRLLRQLLQIPFALVTAAVLGGLIATCFGIEVFISEVYGGPMKSILVFLPTGILTTVLPILTSILTDFASRLTSFENFETSDAHEAAMTQKIFVLNFITSYLGIFLTAFVYVPFGSIIVPYLDVFHVAVRPFARDEKEMIAPKVGFEINPDRLRKQVIYFTVTAQIVSLALEIIVPYLKRRGFRMFNKIKGKRAVQMGGISPEEALKDAPEEAAFLKRVRNEAELETYDVTTDLREMCMQFGYLSLFSVVWPLTAVSFLVNNWIEIRSDALKITVEMKRPTPRRADSIGPWLDSLGFLTWLGSITSAALVYLFQGSGGHGPRGSPSGINVAGLLLTIFFSEHIYMVVQVAVREALAKLESPALKKERAEKIVVRKRFFEEMIEPSKGAIALPTAKSASPTIDRASLEEEARLGSLTSSSAEKQFWGRQRGWEESATVGGELIKEAGSGWSNEGKKQR
ncbi:MAG: hypothetical protein M1814_003387 [Vezdaea aestivalis]|nr:MAG: hypothetical protein M1814_003387 [Vezdaea aestivalis]